MNLWQIDIDFRYIYIQVLLLIQKVCSYRDSNPGTLDYDLDAKPTELLRLLISVGKSVL